MLGKSIEAALVEGAKVLMVVTSPSTLKNNPVVLWLTLVLVIQMWMVVETTSMKKAAGEMELRGVVQDSACERMES